jgi:hypothetical protein
MLSILHPEVIPSIFDYPCGLFPLTVTNGNRPVLVVKAPKEWLLAAKSNLGFKIYVAPLLISGQHTVGLISAFFDDADEPLVLRTTLFEGTDEHRLRQMLLLDALDVYFVDDNNREFLGYEAEVVCPSTTRERFTKAPLLSYHLDAAKAADDQMTRWFGLRSADDDSAAISVAFRKTLIPEDIFLMDLMPQNHSYKGAPAFSHSQLVRDQPGSFQERDIVQLLHRIFLPEQIYLNPLRATDREEIADILVITQRRALFIQAKDSPNTEDILRNSMQRKKATTEKALAKAINQVRGALRYARSTTPMKIIVGKETVEIDLSRLKLRALIVVKELFSDEYGTYTPPIISLSRETRVPCVPLDYSELHMYTKHLEGEEEFFHALDRVFVHGMKTGVFPRLRIWPNEGVTGSS